MQDTQTHRPDEDKENAPFSETKSPLKSKTVIGAGAVLLATAAQRSGVEIGDAEITDLITLAIQLFGVVLAIFGRFKARTTLR